MSNVEQWWSQALAELKTARQLKKDFIYYAACFHAHQAAELGLKALYIKKYSKPYVGHDIVYLAKNLGAEQRIINYTKQIAGAYVETRYPDMAPTSPSEYYTEDDAKEYIEAAEEVIEWIENNS
ncbi:MAG: HEPN domain-containing protein [Candidatus Nanoarchaeia archaeon]